MNIGVIGLGKMGGSIALQMRDRGYSPIVYNRSRSKTTEFEAMGFSAAYSIRELIERLPVPRVIWVMVQSGKPVDDILDELITLADKGDIVVDAGNSNYKDTLRRANQYASEGIRFCDVGTSGGVEGARNGASMMVGGRAEDYEAIRGLLENLCVRNGVHHVGRSGSGHYVKMIHNGIEYGMMQSIAEGFEIMHVSDFGLDLLQISKIWSNGSIISGRLMESVSRAIENNPDMDGIADIVDSSGEGLWTLEAALEAQVPAYVIASSLFKRFESKQDERFSNKLLASMRNEFGGHEIHREKKDG